MDDESPFEKLLNAIDSMPEGYRVKDDVPLIFAMNASYPTVGDLREFVALIKRDTKDGTHGGVRWPRT